MHPCQGQERMVLCMGLGLMKQRRYLACVVQASNLGQEGKLSVLHHCKDRKYYDDILAGKSDGAIAERLALGDVPRVPQLVPDVEALADAPRMLALEDVPRALASDADAVQAAAGGGDDSDSVSGHPDGYCL